MATATEQLAGRRRGDWMQTFTGRQFWPLDPRTEDISLLDIAHSLSMQCRYAGHCREFYSVAEHSMLMAQWFLERDDTESARWALLHDAPEAYLVDVPRPVKPYLSEYRGIKNNLMAVITEAFGLAPGRSELPAQVKEADNRILVDEYRLLMVQSVPWNLPFDPLGVRIRGWSPQTARQEFIFMAGYVGFGK